MTLVATLISNPAAPALTDALLALARDALPTTQPAIWLAAGVAADIPFSEPGANPQGGLGAWAAGVRGALAGAAVDVIVQPRHRRRKKLFLADMDSTIIGQECIDELADYVGLRAHVAAITERAMRGEIAFEPALRERVALLRGLPATVADQVIAQRITLTPGAATLLATMRRHGARSCLVTGGFTLFAERVAAMAGFDESRANMLEVDAAGTLTGRLIEPIFGSDAKLGTLRELSSRHGLAAEDTMVAGDGANDIAMIEAAGLGVAYHAKPKVAGAAAARIDHGDLTALLYLQGYRRAEFVEQGE
ncbi:MAG: phosphoserine phosphatase SerB [Hyphomicrobiales bacterium]|nr:phosphoserine phosphatase SerB [Hyphomicrobiales bacterium]